MADGPDDSWWQGDAQAPTGEAFLKSLDPARASQVKALAEGRMNLPAGYSLRSPTGQQLLADVAQYDPTFDVANAPARTAARKAFTSGKQGQNITSFNTALGHLGTLAQRSEDLSNGSFPLWNGIANLAETATGDPRVTNFNVAKQAVVDELERAFKGTGGNVHEIRQWEDTINSSRSPAQLRGAIAQAADLLNSRIGAMRDSYNSAMGTTDQPLPMLNQHASDALAAFQSPDYQSKGYAAIADHPGNSAPPPSDGTPSPDGTLPAPPAGPGAAPIAPTGVVSSTGASDFSTDEDKRLAADTQALLNDPKSTRADFDALAAKYGRPAFNDTLDRALAARAKGVRASALTPVSGHDDIGSALAPIAGSALGAAGIGAANASTFGALNKGVAGVQALGQRLGGDNHSLGDLYDADLNNADTAIAASDAAHPVATLAGETAGFIAGDGLLSAAPGVAKVAGRIPGTLRPIVGDALYGGATGIGSSDNLGDVPRNAVLGASLGAAGGVLGRGLVKGAAALASPVATGAVQRLTQAGVTLTLGQIAGASGGVLGRAIKGIEDRAAGFPVVGDIINSTRRGGVEDFNRSAINDALAPIGETASGIGHDGIADMQRKASDAIDRALGPINAAPDQQLASDVQAAGRRVTANLSDSAARDYDRAINEHVEPYLRGSTITGDGIKSIKQGLDSEISNLRGQGSTPQDRKLADALSDVRESFLDFADRADPSAASDYAKARQSYALAKRVENAAAKSKDGVFTPNQFRQAVTKRGYGTTTANVARGDAPMQQLATDASTVLPNTVPDSGTAGRAALGVLGARLSGGAALGGTVGYAEGGTHGAALGTLAGASLLSRPGAKAVQYAVAGSRGKALNTLGALLRRNAALGGAVGTPLLLTSPLTNHGP